LRALYPEVMDCW